MYKQKRAKWTIPTQCINLCRQESSSRRKPLRSAVHLEHCTVAILRPSFLPLAPPLSLCLCLPACRTPGSRSLSTVYAANRLLLSRTPAARVQSVAAESIIATNCRAVHRQCRSHGGVQNNAQCAFCSKSFDFQKFLFFATRVTCLKTLLF